MDSITILLAGPVLTAIFGLIILIGFPWLIVPFVSPWIFMWSPVLKITQREGGLWIALERSKSKRVVLTGLVMVFFAQLVPLAARMAAAFAGKAPFDSSRVLFDLCAGSCMSSMMILTMLMCVCCGLTWHSVALRQLIVALCGTSSLTIGTWGVYSIIGSSDGQAGLAYPASPIYAHIGASIIASLFAAPAFIRQWFFYNSTQS